MKNIAEQIESIEIHRYQDVIMRIKIKVLAAHGLKKLEEYGKIEIL